MDVTECTTEPYGFNHRAGGPRGLQARNLVRPTWDSQLLGRLILSDQVAGGPRRAIFQPKLATDRDTQM